MKRTCNFTTGVSILYIVATPIGNMQEMTPRAIEILNSVSIIGCEDTRNSLKLLNYYGIKNKLISCHEHNEEAASKQIIEILLSGQDAAYISDAGYPGISDPGHRLIVNALENDINVSVISGANAMLNALVGSGLDSDHFYFHGFLPSKKSERNKEIEKLKDKPETMIFYESPHRIKSTLTELFEILGNRRICLARELTKKFEEFIRGTLQELCEIDESTLKGEMVLVVEGNKNEVCASNDDTLLALINKYLNEGLTTKEAIRKVSLETNVNKNYVYKLYLDNKK